MESSFRLLPALTQLAREIRKNSTLDKMDSNTTKHARKTAGTRQLHRDIEIPPIPVDVLIPTTDGTFCDHALKVVELTAEFDTTGRQIVINRSIEFPPQYHQAGLGILSYFGTVLREKYPDHNAAVRIEQDGLTVRLIVESETGDRQIIEKALEEYELVVRGEAAPDEFFQSRAKVLELKNELRIRLEHFHGRLGNSRNFRISSATN
jgi:hypothetical protein